MLSGWCGTEQSTATQPHARAHTEHTEHAAGVNSWPAAGVGWRGRTCRRKASHVATSVPSRTSRTSAAQRWRWNSARAAAPRDSPARGRSASALAQPAFSEACGPARGPMSCRGFRKAQNRSLSALRSDQLGTTVPRIALGRGSREAHVEVAGVLVAATGAARALARLPAGRAAAGVAEILRARAGSSQAHCLCRVDCDRRRGGCYCGEVGPCAGPRTVRQEVHCMWMHSSSLRQGSAQPGQAMDCA